MRRDNFEQRMSHIDIEITNLIKASNISQEAQAWQFKRWEEGINEDIRRVDKKWCEKLESTKTAFEKDKEFLRQKQNKRIKNSNTVRAITL